MTLKLDWRQPRYEVQPERHHGHKSDSFHRPPRIRSKVDPHHGVGMPRKISGLTAHFDGYQAVGIRLTA